MKLEPTLAVETELLSPGRNSGSLEIGSQANRFVKPGWLTIGIRLIIAIFGLLDSSFALDPGRSLPQYRLVRWDEEQGLPENRLDYIAQTGDGFMWRGFDHGLIRFDGKRFTFNEGLQANIKFPRRVFGIVPGPSGELWFGSYQALCCRLPDGTFKLIEDNLLDDYCIALLLDSSGTLWCATQKHGLVQLKNGRLLTYPGTLELTQHRVNGMCETSDGFWIGTYFGAYRISKGSGEIRRFTRKDGLAADRVYGVTTDRIGRIWAGTGKGLARLEEGDRFSAVKSNVGDYEIVSLITDSHGMIWAGGSGGGLWRIDPKTVQVSELPPPENGRPIQDVQSIYEDREGNIWLCTNLGLERLSDVNFTTSTVRDGLSNDTINAVAAGASGRIWIGTMDGLACLVDGQVERTAFNANGETAEQQDVTSVHEDAQGVLWFGLRNATLHRFDRGKHQEMAALNTAEDSGAAWATGMWSDLSGNLWVATVGAGLQVFRDGKIEKTYIQANGLTDSTSRHSTPLRQYQPRGFCI